MCDTDGGAGDAGRDAGTAQADASVAADSGIVADASTPDGGVATDGGSGGCDFTGFTPDTTDTTASAADQTLSHLMSTTNEDLYLELFFGMGAADTPHDSTFTGENYATCSECLIMDAECNADRSVCGTHYLAQSGTVSFSALSRTSLTGTLTNVRMIEVTLDPSTFETTPVDGGRVWCIPSLAFDGADTTGG